MSNLNNVHTEEGKEQLPGPSDTKLEDADAVLAELFDCEPMLEFDDELHVFVPTTLLPDDLPELSFSELDNSEEAIFASSPHINSLQQSDAVRVFGTDDQGRQIIVVSACNLPHKSTYTTETLSNYFVSTLDQYVDQDYIIVYFHYGLTNGNKPPLSWFWQTYKMLERKFKKNLKALYVVHPTNVIKTIWTIMKPFISVKFGKKVMYFNNINELAPYVQLDCIDIPPMVLSYDNSLSKDEVLPKEVPAMKQFNTTLAFIAENNPNYTNYTPPVVRECIDYLLQGDNLQQEGLFRRSASHATVKKSKAQANAGLPMDFDTPYAAAVVLKSFFHDLQEPLLPAELYDTIVKFGVVFKNVNDAAICANAATLMVLTHLPLRNYMLLYRLVEFLEKVAAQTEKNLMCYESLAKVFAPSLVWKSNMENGLDDIKFILVFVECIFRNREAAFVLHPMD